MSFYSLTYKSFVIDSYFCYKHFLMRKQFLLHISLAMLLIVLNSCISIKKYNAHIEKEIVPELLKDDADFAYTKLQKLHPHLYDYIAKEQLDYKFDSLKQTITKPLKPNDFYLKLAPVIGEVRQGHLQLRPLSKKLTKKEQKKLEAQKGLFSQFNYYVEDDKIYIKNNPENLHNLKPGTEILEVNGTSAKDLIKKYLPLMVSDGYNTTYHNYALARRWATLYTIDHGYLDSANLKTKYGEELKNVTLKRVYKTKKEKKEEKKDKKDTEEKRTRDYNPQTKSFNRVLHFYDKEHDIAHVKIKTFSGTKSRKFYRETFKKINEKGSDYLILDVRDNLGGSLAEIHNLYSYLSNEKRFRLINDIEVSSRTSMIHADYFTNFPKFIKPVAAIFYPFYYFTSAFAVKKKNEKFILRGSQLVYPKKPKKNAFTGKIFVLVNGSSFSASSTLASKLKFEKRAKIIGEETGGANDATVAGQYSTEKLPNSKLQLPIGLMYIEPKITPDKKMHGVFPQVEIIPSLEQVVKKDDVQLKKVIEEIKSSKIQ